MLNQEKAAENKLRAIMEPERREILGLIQARELSSGEIASHFHVTHSAVSQQLKLLADAGLVHVRKEGTRRLYRACPEGLAELRSFLIYLISTFNERES